MTIHVEGLPAEIYHSDRCVLWSYEHRNGHSKPTKVPRQIGQPSVCASVTDSSTWGSFADGLMAHQNGHADGVGLILGHGIVGVDLDGCRDVSTGEITPSARSIIDQLDSFTEISVSGTGVHILVKGSGLPGTRRRKGGIEMYDSDRYFVLTGQHVDGTPTTIRDRHEALTRLHAEIFGVNGDHRDDCVDVRDDIDLDDTELLELARHAKNGAAFDALWRGDHSYSSQSVADLALCNQLAFWTRRNPNQIDHLFRQSGLMRSKWDTRRGDSSYGAQTVRKAVADCHDIFNGGVPPAIYISENDPPTADPIPEPATPPTFKVVTGPDSFVTQYLRHMTQRTDAPPQSHELMALGALSVLSGPNPRIQLATSTQGQRLVLWTNYIVDSTIGRKSTVLNFPRDIIVAVLGPDAVIEWEGSPQGLIQRLQSRDGQAACFVRDELSGLVQQMNRGGHLSGLEQTLIRGYDGRVLENIRTRKKNRGTGELESDTDRCENPYLAALTATTWRAFVERATIDNVLSGFLARIIFVTGSSDPRPLTTSTPALEEDWEALIAQARRYQHNADLVHRVDVDDDVMAAAWDLEQTWTTRAQTCSRPDAAAPSLKRLAEAVLKTAALLALEKPSLAIPRIRMKHWEPAEAIGQRWVIDTLKVIETLGQTSFQRQSDDVAETVNRHPNGIKLSDLYRRHRRLRQRDFHEILAALETQERIRRVKIDTSKGRPPTVYIPGRTL